MTGYITFYSSAEINELELSQFATDFVKQAGIVRQGGNLGFEAAQLSPLDGLKYNITSGGTFYIANDAYADNGSNPKYWMGRFSGATETLTFSANSSGSTRIDLIAIKVDTTVTDANPDNTGVASLVVVEGTPGAGVPATPANHIALYQVTIVNGETEITDAEVTDVREEAVLNIPDASITNLSLSKVAPVPLTEGQMINGKLAVSVNSNNLTVAIKTLAGNDASTSDPIYIMINGVLRTLTTALSVTKNAGTNWFNAGSSELAAHEIDYFAYLAWDSSNAAVRIGFARIPYARIYSDFSATATDERHGAFSTAPGGNDSVYVVGRFAATLSAGPSYTWSIPSYTNVNLIQRPIYSTRDLNYSPVYTGFSAAPTNVVSTYRIIDNYVDLFYRAGQPGTSNATNLQISLPFSVITLMSYSIRHYSRGTDNGSTVVSDVTYTISSGGTVLSAQLGGNSNGWTNANGKKLDWADAMYRIA